MDLQTRNAFIKQMMESGEKILFSKGKDYSINGNSFGEFIREGKDTNTSIEKVIWHHFGKHEIAILNAVNGTRLQGDKLREHIIDAANFLYILCAYMESESTEGKRIPIEDLIEDFKRKTIENKEQLVP